MFFGKKKSSPRRKGIEIINVFTPFTGKLIKLEDVNDPVFSSGAMGKGFAIQPLANEKKIQVTPPLEGKILTVMPESRHAYGIQEATSNVEYLVHIGIDTVELKGAGFSNNNIVKNQVVKLTDELVEVDLSVLTEANKDLATIVVFPNDSLAENNYRLIIDETLYDQVVYFGNAVAKLIKN